MTFSIAHRWRPALLLLLLTFVGCARGTYGPTEAAPTPDQPPCPTGIPSFTVRAMPAEDRVAVHGVVSDFGSRGTGTAGEPTWGHNTPKLALWKGALYFIFFSIESAPQGPQGWSWRLARLNPSSGVAEFGFHESNGVLQPGTLIVDRNGYAHVFDFGQVADGLGVRHVMSASPVEQCGWSEPPVSKGYIGPGVFGYIGVAYDQAAHHAYLAYALQNRNLMELRLRRAVLPESAQGEVSWSQAALVTSVPIGLVPTYPYVVPLGGGRVAVAWMTARVGVGYYTDARLRVFTDVLAGTATAETVLAEAASDSTLDLKDVHWQGDRVWFLVQRAWSHAGHPPGTVFASYVPIDASGAPGLRSSEEAIREPGEPWSYEAAKLYRVLRGWTCLLITAGRAEGDGVVIYSRSDAPDSRWTRTDVLQPTVDPAYPGVSETPSHAAVRKPWWGGETTGPIDVLYSGLVPRTHPTRALSPVYNVWFLRLTAATSGTGSAHPY